MKFIGMENIPKDGRLILFSNHTSNADPVILGSKIKRYVAFMAKEELFKNPFLGKILRGVGAFPVKRGAGDIGAIKSAIAQLKQEHILVMFPEGTRRKKGKQVDLKPGVAMIAIKTQSLVVPAAIIGGPKLFGKNKIIYGKPIDLSQYYDQHLSNEDYIKIVQELMDQVKRLAEE
jgi:1-acyl-sn-glycerol-3-phosphate acyltransferase